MTVSQPLNDLLWDERLLDLAARLVGAGTWILIPSTGHLAWSPNLFRILGHEPDAIEPSVEQVLEQSHPHDRDALAAFFAAPSGTLEARIVRPDGTVRLLRGTVHGRVPASNGRPECLVGVVQDMTEHRRATRQVAAHVAVAEALADWSTLEESGPELVRGLAEALGCFRGGLAVQRGADELEPLVLWQDPAIDAYELDVLARTRVPMIGSTAGAAWQAREPVIINDPHDERLGPFRALELLTAVRGVLAFPVLAGDEVLAVVALASHEPLHLTETERLSIRGIGHELGQFLARRRAELGGSKLSPREVEVLQRAADGRTGPQIAQDLFISQATVKTHFEHIYAKLGVSDRPGAVAQALRLGLVK